LVQIICRSFVSVLYAACRLTGEAESGDGHSGREGFANVDF